VRLVRGRLAAVSVWASLGAGAWVGAAIGLVLGALAGALLAWFAGVGLGWQRELAFTLGVNRSLLPLGDQIPALRWLSANWFLVVPLAALVGALVTSVVGGLIGALLAAAYNRSPRHASVVVELPDEEAEAPGVPAPDGLVLDLDGTLVDTVDTRIRSWLSAFDEADIPATVAQLAPLIGSDGRRLSREVAAAAGTPIDEARSEEIDRRAGELYDELNTDPRPLPGVAQLISAAEERRLPWAIATSSRREQVQASVRALGLEREPLVVDGAHVQHAKPAPDLLLHAAERLGVPAERCWCIGDATWDMRAAGAAGMVGIAVLAGSAADEEALRAAGASVLVDTLEELIPLLP
jgi:phosphoglycolate phosphatase